MAEPLDHLARNALRLARTVAYLRPIQIVGRASFRLRRPRPETGPPPPVRAVGGRFVETAGRAPSMLSPHRFRLLNEERDITTAGDWEAPEAAKLWLYNLHYFDDLVARDAASRRAWHVALVQRWIDENPPGHGTGWEPYPTSLRMVAWIKWALGGGPLTAAALQSLAVQARWLEQRLEVHLLGNHLFANAKALVFAGAYFAGAEARRWMERGLAILSREVPEQILGDGGHFERSTMYHALALEDVLDLVNICRALPDAVPDAQRAAVAGWGERAQAMRRWLGAMSHPDGEIALFNDAALGIAPPPAALEQYAARLELPPVAAPRHGVTHLAESGYVRVQRDELVALLDVAPIGPRYLTGHAHADTLTFEVSLSGRRVVVNSGTSVYGVSAERLRQRGTAAHNTVVVDGENSSEVWSGFRTARRSTPVGLAIAEHTDAVEVRCGHDGYRRLPGRVDHVRTWRFAPRSLAIEDQLAGSFREAVARVHFHPDVRVGDSDGALPTGGCLTWSAAGARPRVVAATYHPAFGVTLPSRCLELQATSLELGVTLSWGDA